jgi:hypothetical protein
MLVVGMFSLLIAQAPEEIWAWAFVAASDADKPAVEAAAANRIVHPDMVQVGSLEKREADAAAFLVKVRAHAADIGPADRLDLEGEVWVRVKDGAVSLGAREHERAGVSFVLVNVSPQEAVGTPEQQKAWAAEHPSPVAAVRVVRPDASAIVNGRVVVFAIADTVTVTPGQHYKKLTPLTFVAAPVVLPRQRVPTPTTNKELWKLFLQGRPSKAAAPENALRALTPALATARDEFAGQRARADADALVASARAAKPGPVDLVFSLPWQQAPYDFKLKGYPIQWPDGVPYDLGGNDSVAVVAEKGGSLLLPIAPDLAEQQVSWRLQADGTGLTRVYFRVRGKKLGAISGQERHDQALKKARGLERMNINLDGPGSDELRLQIDSIELTASDGSLLGVALPQPSPKKR